MFDSCECVDPITSHPIGHPRGKCRVPGLVMVKIMYTPEEAQRRNEEDREVFEAFTKRRRQVRGWEMSRGGLATATISFIANHSFIYETGLY